MKGISIFLLMTIGKISGVILRAISIMTNLYLSVFKVITAHRNGVAHAVVALVYVETDGDKYLRVADGLTTSQRYLNYDYYGVHEGFRVRIS